MRRAGPALRLAAGLVVVLFGYACVTFIQVWRASLGGEARQAEAIIVLGAAQYHGRPSPVLQARLDHAAALYDAGVAPVVVVTGGRRPGDTFTEARAGGTYLARRGVPADAVVWETTGRTSWESLAATARVLRERGIDDVVLVSDPFHAYRIAGIAEELGLDASVSPTPSSPIGGTREARQLARETAAVALARLVGYRRLAVLEQRLPPWDAVEVQASAATRPAAGSRRRPFGLAGRR